MTLEEAFRYCLENPDNLSTEQLFARFPDYRGELAPLLALDRRLVQALPQSLAAERRAAMKSRIMAAAAQQAQPTTKRPAPKNTTIEIRPARRPAWFFRLGWSAAAVALSVLLLWFIAAGSLADNPLYNIKLNTEDVLLNFVGERPAQVRGHLDLANTRLSDLRSMQSGGHLSQAAPAFDNYDYHLSEATNLSGVLNGDERTEIDKVLYVSSRAGAVTFEGLKSSKEILPSEIQEKIGQTLMRLTEVSTSTSSELQAAGVDPEQVLAAAGQKLAALLTPLPGVVSLTATPVVAPTAAATATPLCPDRYEDDGVVASAKLIGLGQTQDHAFCDRGDADWIAFSAEASSGYRIETSELTEGADTYMYLFAPDGKTVLASNDNGPSLGLASQILFYPTQSGQYYLQVKNQNDRASIAITYSISLSLIDN